MKTGFLTLLFLSAFMSPIFSIAKSCGDYLGIIDRNLLAIKKNSFQTERGLAEYGKYFFDLEHNLQNLGSQGHWIDLGAGRATAMKSYMANYRTPFQMTAIAYKKIFGAKPSRITYLTGKLFSEIPNNEIKKADIITDYYGVLSYTNTFVADLNKALGLLKNNGILYIYNGGGFDIIQVQTPKGRLDLKSFLQSIPGLNVTYIHKNNGNHFESDVRGERKDFGLKVIRTSEYQENSISGLKVIETSDLTLPTRRVFTFSQH